MSTDSKLINLIAESEGVHDSGVMSHIAAAHPGDFEGMMARFRVLGRMLRDDKDDARQMRLRTELKAFTVDGKVWVYNWGRDCDQFEADGISQIDATLEAFESAENDMYDGAEGPCHMHMISPKEAGKFERSWKDHAAEQMNY